MSLLTKIKTGVKELNKKFRPRIVLGIITTVLILSIPWIISQLYVLGNDISLVETVYSPVDLLPFYGTLLTSIVIIILYYQSLQQGRRLADMNESLLEFDKEEYTPFLSIASYSEKENNSTREPAKSHEIHKRSVVNEADYDYQAENEYAIYKAQVEKVFSEARKKGKRIEDIRDINTKIASLLREQSYKDRIEFHELYWVISKTETLQGRDIGKRELYEQKMCQFTFKNLSKSKIKKIIIPQIKMSNMGDEWVLTVNEHKNTIESIILPNETLNFNINIYWDKKDEDMKNNFPIFPIYFTIKLNMETIGGIKQSQTIELKSSLGILTDISYQLN